MASPVETCRCYCYLYRLHRNTRFFPGCVNRIERYGMSLTHRMMCGPWPAFFERLRDMRIIGQLDLCSLFPSTGGVRKCDWESERRAIFVLREWDSLPLYCIICGGSMALYLLLSSRGRVLYLDRVLQSGMALQGTRKREAIGGMMHTLQS